MSVKTFELKNLIDAGATQFVPVDHHLATFAGGEPNVVLSPHMRNTQIAFVTSGTGNDILTLAHWQDAVRRQNSHARTIAVMPYLPAARADRGTPLGAKVYADIVNNLDIDDIVCLDPHSDVAPALYERLTTVHLEELPLWNSLRGSYAGVVAPDLGARKRAQAVADSLNVPLYQATKVRDFSTREISGTECEQLPVGKFLVVDDICDGGRTFVELARVINEQGGGDRLVDLWVTHGIFSYNAMDKLSALYHTVRTTNSLDTTGEAMKDYYPVMMVQNVLPFLINKVA